MWNLKINDKNRNTLTDIEQTWLLGGGNGGRESRELGTDMYTQLTNAQLHSSHMLVK